MNLVALVTAATMISSPTIASVQLPKNLNFYSIEPHGAGLLVSGSTTTGGECAWTLVEPMPLRVTAQGANNCSRASLSSHSVYAVQTRNPKSFAVRVQIARVDPRTHRVSKGPVVMRFQEVSDTHLESAYGPRTLWLFDSATTTGAAVMQISATTGRVENVVRMPRIFRPILAADADGLWLAIAPNGGAGRGPSPIYHVAPGARAPVLVQRGGRAAMWIVAARHTVWADVISGTSRQEIWRFDGPSGAATALARADELNSWAASVATDGSVLWSLSEVPLNGTYYSCTSDRVIRINAKTGQQSVVATVPTPNAQCFGAAFATFNDGTFSFVLGNRLYSVPG